MPSLKDIKDRIKSVKGTQKITNAMKLVSASKFAKANQMVNASRPYSDALKRATGRIIPTLEDDFYNPLLGRIGDLGLKNGLGGAGDEGVDHGHADGNAESKASLKKLILVFSTDRGLCGGLNTNNFKNIEKWLKEQQLAGHQVDIVIGGRKAHQNRARFTAHGAKIIKSMEKLTERVDFDKAKDLASYLIDNYRDNGYDEIHLGFTRFESALSQVPIVERFLPISLEEVVLDVGSEQETELKSADDYIIEPDAESVVNSLIERQLFVLIKQVMLESMASEHGARMTAMDSATNNAKEVTKKLTLQYNRARQAAITTELTEIISGAESL